MSSVHFGWHELDANLELIQTATGKRPIVKQNDGIG